MSRNIEITDQDIINWLDQLPPFVPTQLIPEGAMEGSLDPIQETSEGSSESNPADPTTRRPGAGPDTPIPLFSEEEWFATGKAFPPAVKNRVIHTILKGSAMMNTLPLTHAALYAAAFTGAPGNAETAILISEAMKTDDPWTKSIGAVALGHLKVQAHFPMLRDLLLDKTESENVRANAALALGAMQHDESEEILGLIAKDEEDSDFVRSCASDAIDAL